MLHLSSGLVIDLSVNRAKYHALRKHHHGPGVKHQDLYPLVDIIFRHKDPQGHTRSGWTEYDYSYSGYTLGDISQISDWKTKDINQLKCWIKQPEQQQRIETARRRLVNKQALLSTKLNSSPDYLFSLLQSRIEKLPMKTATAEQWLATVINMQKTGLRKEELIWSGLYEFLKLQPQHVILNKQQLLNTIDFKNTRLELSSELITSTNGNLKFNEVARQMQHQVVYRATLKLDHDCLCILRYVDDVLNYRVGLVKTLSSDHHMAMNKYWFALDPYGRAIQNPATSDLFFSSSESAMNACNQHSHRCYGLRTGYSFNTQYDHITLHGGDNYREWIISLPDYQRTFFGGHFFDHNILAHIRTTTRDDQQGRKLLFIEEIQSDWHQSAAIQGYDNSVWGKIPNAPFKKEWPALTIKLMLIRASQNGYDGIAWPSGTIQEMRYSRSLQAIKHYYDHEIPHTLNKLGKAFSTQVECTSIATRDPWLNLVRKHNKWQVTDGQGKFKTRHKYNSREEAMAVLNRHCRKIKLQVPVFYINDPLRNLIMDQGLPLFGETLV